jgi:hypothetical protein
MLLDFLPRRTWCNFSEEMYGCTTEGWVAAHEEHTHFGNKRKKPCAPATSLTIKKTKKTDSKSQIIETSSNRKFQTNAAHKKTQPEVSPAISYPALFTAVQDSHSST